jgi:uncharacterized protein (TIGR03000 family)
MSNKALLAAALCALALPASASAQYRASSGGQVVGRPLVVDRTRGPILTGDLYGYYGTNTARRLNFYELPRYHFYPDNFAYFYEPYGAVTLGEVPRFTSTYPVAAEVYAPYYVGYYGTDNDLRRSFYALPQYPRYVNDLGDAYDRPYGEEVLRFGSSYPVLANAYEPYYVSSYYVSYGSTAMPANGMPKPAPQPSTKQPSTTGSLKVYVPTSTAEVWCNGVKIQQTGPSREITPELASGQSMSCEIRVQWMEDGKSVTQTRTAQLRPGSQAVLAFSGE